MTTKPEDLTDCEENIFEVADGENIMFQDLNPEIENNSPVDPNQKYKLPRETTVT